MATDPGHELGATVIPFGDHKGETFDELAADPTGGGLLYLGWVRDGRWVEYAYPDVHGAAVAYLNGDRPRRLLDLFRMVHETRSGAAPLAFSARVCGPAPDRVKLFCSDGAAWYLRETPERACAGEFVREVQAAANVIGSLPWRGWDRSAQDDEMASGAYLKLRGAIDAVIKKSIEMSGAGPTEAVTEGKANDADRRSDAAV